jgi:phospholipase D1/2
VDLERARVGRTRVVDEDPSNPRWNESFRIYCAHFTTDVVFSVKAALPIDAALVGRAYLPVRDVLKAGGGEVIDRWLEVVDEGMVPLLHGPKIHVRVSFTAVAADPQWGRGVAGVPQFAGVPKTFFKQQQGCRVTLYQDAHVPDAFKPEPAIQLAGGRTYEPPRCWEDVYDAIAGAKHVVYVAGWSVVPDITLVRDGGRRHPGGGETLGELLKRKADEGVRVLMLVWDDPTSSSTVGNDGQMKTNDTKTFDYFSESRVHCTLCPREPDDAASFAQGLKTFAFSHHQKCVIVDVADDGSGGGRRRIVSFVGGLDLTSGRYDTPEHTLFRTLNTAHSNDFYQGNLPGAVLATGGPREPWHDIHCRIEGPAAWDVLHNFEQRWRKQGGDDESFIPSLLTPWKTPKSVLVDLRGMEDVIAPRSTPAAGDGESWNVQVFRSIDNSAVDGFPDTPAEAAQSGLVSGKDHVIERSIQDAYIHAIRRANRFIYIENQYFLGSSFGWKPDGKTPGNINALHLIPRELSLKIVSKIEAGEPFAVYVVVPMWPEGDPSSWSVQAILHWQRKTMEMMYGDIAAALKAKNIDADPKDYLSFFCLGNRETKLEVPREYEPKRQPPLGSDYDRAQKARRTMVYVHSKLMIGNKPNTKLLSNFIRTNTNFIV